MSNHLLTSRILPWTLFIVAVAMGSSIARNSIVASWTFDSVSGSTFRDVTGNGYDAVGTGDSIGTTGGLAGKALTCSGNTFKLQVRNSKDAFAFPIFTIEAWIYSGAILIKPGPSICYREIFNYTSVGTDVAGGYGLHVTDGKLECVMARTNKSWLRITGARILMPNTWYHVAGVYNGAELKLYLNGASAATELHAGGYVPPRHDAVVGCEMLSDGSVVKGWRGKIDEMKLYDYALTKDTIFSHYSALKPPPEPPKVVASWTFDSVSGNIFYDVTGHGYDAVGSGDSIRISSDGIFGKALECRGPKGTNNTFDIRVKNSELDFNLNTLTLETWIYPYVNIKDTTSLYNQKNIFEFVSSGLPKSKISGGYALSIRETGQLMFCWSSPTNNEGSDPWPNIMDDSAVLPNRWYHVAATFDIAAAKLYVNGILKKAISNPRMYFPSSNPCRIGCIYQIIDSAAGLTASFFNGRIDELKLYNYVLDDQTIRKQYETLRPAHENPFKINFGMKAVYCRPGECVWVPIYVTNYGPFGINSCQFSLRTDPSRLQLLSLSKDYGLIKTWNTVNCDSVAADSVYITLAGTNEIPSVGEGELLRCRYRVLSAAAFADTCFIRVTDFKINEVQKNWNLITPNTVPGKVMQKKPAVCIGDATGDGQITVLDARDILSYAVGAFAVPDSADHSSFTVVAADVTGNGIVTSYDAALVFQYSLGMVPDFPVEHGKYSYEQHFAGPDGNKSPATLAITLASKSDSEGMKFNLVGVNLRDFAAGEFTVVYNPAVVTIGNCSITTGLPATTLFTRPVPTKHLIAIALATKSILDSNEPVILATIALPPNSTADLSNAFSLATALINEGKIPTNIPSGPVAVTKDGKCAHAAADGGPRIAYYNGALHISTDSKNPIRVQLFALNGRRIETKEFREKGMPAVRVVMNGHPRGAYIYRVAQGPGEIKTGRIIVKE